MGKKIAFIADGWNQYTTYAWVDGALDWIRKERRDWELYHYSCNGNWYPDQKWNDGEYGIFRLAGRWPPDGIILDATNIIDPERRERVVAYLRSFSVPVISIGLVIDGFYYVGIDGYTPTRELMKHLHGVHGCRTFACAAGAKDNFENAERVRAYVDALRAFGLSAESNPILYGDFDYRSGENAMKALLERSEKNGEELPDAIVCTNDNLACGVITAAARAGVETPRDIRVTGFDDLDKAAYFEPQITTVQLGRERIGRRAARLLNTLLDGGQIPDKTFVLSKVLYSESCGCPNEGRVNYRSHIRDQILGGIGRRNNDEYLAVLEHGMEQQKTLKEALCWGSGQLSCFACDAIFTLVDRRLYLTGMEDALAGEEWDCRKITVAGGLLAGRPAGPMEPADFFRLVREKAPGNAWMFSPFHIGARMIGFFAVLNPRFLSDGSFYYSVQMLFARVAEHRYRDARLRSVIRQLQETYDRDQLTGLYNRVAFTEKLLPAFAKLQSEGISCAICFADADDFKQANDVRGHGYGDCLLQSIAETFQSAVPEGGFVCRYGGDEFVAVFPCESRARAECFREQVTERLEAKGIPISIGLAVTQPEEECPLEDYIVLADRDMYEVKKQRKS
ncbi:diguanylate cyclase domain-containing protein [Lachnoclostridium sp. Marseille-P6806]|uniref:diguanylate cyclase domain-containing protein n=1 Tax=Lachnoclostridium sp. Marseille-P6806 TaxID=2364793 RepID=UPI00103263C4|nr:GGDEF domain-containing protein [Lachnoclostridium sp. Marseille-P6806]